MGAEGEVFVFMGPPEAGKTTQAKRLSDRIGGAWIWDKDIMSQIEDPDRLWEALETVMSRVPMAKPIVLDGVVNRKTDASELALALVRTGRQIVRVICLHIYEEESLQRITRRISRPGLMATQKARWKAYRVYTIPALEIFRGGRLLSVVMAEGTEDEVEARISAALNGPADQI